MWPIQSGTSDAGRVPKKLRKVVTLQGIAELLEWVVDWSLQQWLPLISRYESSLMTIIRIEKKLCTAVSAVRQACVETLHCLWNTSHVVLKMQHWCGGKITTWKARWYTLLWFRKKQSSCGKLKQKEGERSEAGKFNAAKDDLII